MRLIDADSLLLRMEKRADCEPNHFRVIKRMMKIVAQEPTECPVKHGHWSPVHADSRGYAEVYMCSCCEKRVYLAYYDRECDYLYCPWCGANMEEVEE